MPIPWEVIMVKDIYIIKNKFNNKVYIGQSANPRHRWEQYRSAVKKKPEAQLITRAMSKYGFDNFWMEILETNIENYNEREKYWIQQYNSIAPNGYNLADGGKGSGNGTYSQSASITDPVLLASVIDDIIQDILPLSAVAEKYHLSYGVINEINQGHTYYNQNLHYPLRNSHKYSPEKLKQITYALKYELDKSLKAIATEYQCDWSFLNDINQGRAYFREYLTYPIRKGKMKQQQEYLPLLIEDLKYSSLTQKELAKKYQISIQTVSNINRGHTGHQNSIIYPIRDDKERGRICLTPNELEQIYTQLKDKQLSIRQIADYWSVSATTIQNINNGKTKKYYSPKCFIHH